jgi:hypothetical protein
VTQRPLCGLFAAVAAAAAGRCQVPEPVNQACGVKIIDMLAAGTVLAIQSRRRKPFNTLMNLDLIGCK